MTKTMLFCILILSAVFCIPALVAAHAWAFPATPDYVSSWLMVGLGLLVLGVACRDLSR